jgi:5-methylcytosine-specific restriction endonuclease McrA
MRAPNYSCPTCKKLYYRGPSSVRRNRDWTCSRYCAARYFRDKGKFVECPVCSELFWQRRSVAKLGYGNYCSHECWGSTRKTPIGEHENKWSSEQLANWKDSKCGRCGSTENLELDHIIARSLGGLATRENCQTLCKTCNNRKFQLEDLPAFLRKQKSKDS